MIQIYMVFINISESLPYALYWHILIFNTLFCQLQRFVFVTITCAMHLLYDQKIFLSSLAMNKKHPV